MYASIGGGNPEFFKIRSSNKLYDEIIKYSCNNDLNLHLGIGEYKEGYTRFKMSAGATGYKCERFPNDEFIIKTMNKLFKLKITGKILKYLSKKYPKKITYEAMPFT